MKALVGAFNQEKALVGAFSVIVQPVVEPMDRFTALVKTNRNLTKRQGCHKNDGLSRVLTSSIEVGPVHGPAGGGGEAGQHLVQAGLQHGLVNTVVEAAHLTAPVGGGVGHRLAVIILS